MAAKNTPLPDDQYIVLNCLTAASWIRFVVKLGCKRSTTVLSVCSDRARHENPMICRSSLHFDVANENHTARLFFWATTVETRRASSIELARLRTRPPVAFLCIGIPAGIGRDASAVFSQSPKNVWYLLS